MNSNYGEISNKYGAQSGKNGSVFPKDREHVSTMMGKKMAEVGSKAVKSTFNAIKDHTEIGKKSQAQMNSNYGRSSNNGSVFPKDREHVSTMMGKKMAEVGSKAVKSTFNAFKDKTKMAKK